MSQANSPGSSGNNAGLVVGLETRRPHSATTNPGTEPDGTKPQQPKRKDLLRSQRQQPSLPVASSDTDTVSTKTSLLKKTDGVRFEEQKAVAPSAASAGTGSEGPDSYQPKKIGRVQFRTLQLAAAIANAETSSSGTKVQQLKRTDGAGSETLQPVAANRSTGTVPDSTKAKQAKKPDVLVSETQQPAATTTSVCTVPDGTKAQTQQVKKSGVLSDTQPNTDRGSTKVQQLKSTTEVRVERQQPVGATASASAQDGARAQAQQVKKCERVFSATQQPNKDSGSTKVQALKSAVEVRFEAQHPAAATASTSTILDGSKALQAKRTDGTLSVGVTAGLDSGPNGTKAQLLENADREVSPRDMAVEDTPPTQSSFASHNKTEDEKSTNRTMVQETRPTSPLPLVKDCSEINSLRSKLTSPNFVPLLRLGRFESDRKFDRFSSPRPWQSSGTPALRPRSEQSCLDDTDDSAPVSRERIMPVKLRPAPARSTSGSPKRYGRHRVDFALKLAKTPPSMKRSEDARRRMPTPIVTLRPTSKLKKSAKPSDSEDNLEFKKRAENIKLRSQRMTTIRSEADEISAITSRDESELSCRSQFTDSVMQTSRIEQHVVESSRQRGKTQPTANPPAHESEETVGKKQQREESTMSLTVSKDPLVTDYSTTSAATTSRADNPVEPAVHKNVLSAGVKSSFCMPRKPRRKPIEHYRTLLKKPVYIKRVPQIVSVPVLPTSANQESLLKSPSTVSQDSSSAEVPPSSPSDSDTLIPVKEPKDDSSCVRVEAETVAPQPTDVGDTEHLRATQDRSGQNERVNIAVDTAQNTVSSLPNSGAVGLVLQEKQRRPVSGKDEAKAGALPASSENSTEREVRHIRTKLSNLVPFPPEPLTLKAAEEDSYSVKDVVVLKHHADSEHEKVVIQRHEEFVEREERRKDASETVESKDSIEPEKNEAGFTVRNLRTSFIEEEQQNSEMRLRGIDEARKSRVSMQHIHSMSALHHFADIRLDSTILTTDQTYRLLSWMPQRFHVQNTVLLYRMLVDGTSFSTLWNRIERHVPTFLVIETTDDQKIGAYCSSSWHERLSQRGFHFFGTGETFLFVFRGEEKSGRCYPWVGVDEAVSQGGISHNKELFMAGGPTDLIVGGGNGEGLAFHDTLESGATDRCDTFNNQPLVQSKYFTVRDLEVFAFEGTEE